MTDGWNVDPRPVPEELTESFVATPYTETRHPELPTCRNCGETIREYGTAWEHKISGERRCKSSTTAEPENHEPTHITGWASFGELLGADGVRRLFGAIQ